MDMQGSALFLLYSRLGMLPRSRALALHAQSPLFVPQQHNKKKRQKQDSSLVCDQYQK
jgi:hypothetical protein